jgi:transposase
MGLRKRVVKFIKTGGSKAGAARRFDLGRSTVTAIWMSCKQGRWPPKKS